MSTYLICDMNNCIARSFHKMPELRSSSGFRTGGIYGALRSLSWVRNSLRVPLYHTVIVWDGGHATWRLELYPEYKAGRKLNTPRTPEEEADKIAYRAQLKAVREIMGTLETKQIQVPGVEADDLISLLTGYLQQDGHEVVIFSGDHDMHQLVNGGVRVFDPSKELMGEKEVLEKWQLQRIQDIPLMKSLWGDSSDNIKGVPQVGEKRARIVCCYLEAAEDYRLKVRRPGWDEKDGKWIQQALEHEKIVTRNLLLMTLPKTVDTWLYSDEQAISAFEQFLAPSEGDRLQFISLLEAYEMDSILESISRW